MMKLLYFAWLRERIGHSEEALTLPDSVRTVSDLMDHLSGRGGGYAAAFGQADRLRAAVNQVVATPSTRVGADDEVAFFPPITGG